MANERGFLARFVLEHLQQPEELLNCFRELNYTLYTFSTITREELEEDLTRAGYDCDVEQLFRRIAAWRFVQNHEPHPDQLAAIEEERPVPEPVVEPLPAPQVEPPPAPIDEPPFNDLPNPYFRFGPAELRRLLEESIVGRAILGRSSWPLSDPSQRELVGIIAVFHLALKVKASQDIMDRYATAIVQLLPKERKDIYFLPRGGQKRHPGGKVYNKIVNLKHSRKLREKREEEHLANLAKRQKIEQGVSEEPTVPTVAEEALIWLSTHTQPWGTTLQKWTASFELRKDDLQKRDKPAKVLETYIGHYKDPKGFQLIDLDYRMLYDKNIDPLVKWHSAIPKLASFFRAQPYKEDFSSALASALGRPDLSDDSRTCIVLTLLNTFLPPAAVNSNFKPTMQYVHREIITYVESEDAIRSAIDEYYAILAGWGAPPIAKLVFTGSSATAPLGGKFFVVYKDFRYEAQTAVQAVDVLVKMNLVLGLEFSRVSRLVWNFICHYVYEVPRIANYGTVMRFARQVGAEELSDW